MSAWVIGGTSGIGAAIVDNLRAEDIPVVGTGEACDVTSYRSLHDMIRELAGQFGEDNRIEQIYFCAGVTELEWLGVMGPRGVANQIGIMEVNVGGFITLMDVLVDAWNENLLAVNTSMKVCAISSDAAERPMRTSIGYCASKAALNAAIKVAARELGPRGWKVFGIAPGMIDGSSPYGSKMTKYIDKRVPQIREWPDGKTADTYEREQAVVKSPLRIHPGNVARVAVETSLSFSAHMNGSIITINGGR
jgi:NAD(P)-dependent dehydrogenase (short-subunit alcohol dehydrogenase family)